VSPESAVVWREENRDIFAQTTAAAAEQLSIPQLAVEKDYWVCQALRAIEEHAPGETIFKGGTSLEKQRLIERFSEDIDLLVIGTYDSRRAVERALKGMCSAAQNALPGSTAEKRNSGGKPGSMHRSVYLSAPLSPQTSSSAIADPGGILVELGQSGGDHPVNRRPVTSILARQLAAADIPIEAFADLAPFEVLMLHPGRTLLEKLLRVNNFVLDAARRADHGWPRIGRQFYDIWALLGNEQVLTFLRDRVTAAAVLADCIGVSEDFLPDLPPPKGGFAACEAFNPDWDHASQLRAEHESAMRDLYYGATTPPNYDEVIDRIRSNARLLNLAGGSGYPQQR
jgi:hypothetical protein